MLKRFFWSIWDDWWALMGGVVGVILSALAAGFQIAGKEFPSWAFFIAGITCIVFCSYRVWRKVQLENDRLSLVDLVFWKEGMRARLLLGEKLHYSTAIKNVSRTRTIKNCKVILDRSKDQFGPDPRIPNLPARLHRSGRSDHRAPEGIDLGPGESAVFDFLRIEQSEQENWRWDIPVAWDPNGQEIPVGSYELTFLATGEDVPSQEQTLLVEPMSSERDVTFKEMDKPIQEVTPPKKRIRLCVPFSVERILIAVLAAGRAATNEFLLVWRTGAVSTRPHTPNTSAPLKKVSRKVQEPGKGTGNGD